MAWEYVVGEKEAKWVDNNLLLSASDLSAWLNERGAEGWELVVGAFEVGRFRGIFKREVP